MIRYAIAGLFAVAMVGVAYADHKPNHNPGGGGEPPAPTPQVLVVRDGDKNFVGEFAGRSSQDQGFLVTYRGDPAEDIFFETFPRIALAIFTGTAFGGHNTFGVTADVIYWTETGCTGTPYIQANRSGDLPNILGLPRLVARDTILGAVAYIPVSTPVTAETVLIETRENGAGFDNNTGTPLPYDCLASGDSTPNLIETTEVNIGFFPPYSLGE